MPRIRIGAMGRVGVIVAAAVLAWGVWWAGIAWLHGWEGLRWLQGFQWSAVPICVIIVAASALAASRDGDVRRVSGFVALGSVLCLAAFIAARVELYAIFARSFTPSGVGPIVRLPLYGLAVSVGLTALARRFLVPLQWRTSLYLAGALALTGPLAFLTVTLIPADRQPDIFNAIRLGYPVFWTTLLLPAALWWGARGVAPDRPA